MARKSKKTNSKKQNTASSPSSSTERKTSNIKRNADEADDGASDEKITWEDIAAMSDSDDDGDGGAGMGIELDAKSKSLRQAINDGKFNGLLASLRKSNGDEDEEEFEEDDLESSEEDQEEASIGADAEGQKETDDEAEEAEEEENEDSENDEELEEVDEAEAIEKEEAAVVKIGSKEALSEEKNVENDSDDDHGDVEDDDEEDKDEDEVDGKVQKYKRLETTNHTNSKALSVVTTEVAASHLKLPWAETFVIVPPTPLPFGENGNPESNPLDIHDDLKREVAFYNTALEAVNLARKKCKEAGVPFARPEDFFAEMVKTDDHMAMVKDRLIFENKKIEAVAQRKSNKEQKLRAKESQSNRLAEKSKRKRDHFQQVEEWANSAAKQRGGALRDDMDEKFLNGRNSRNGGDGPNKSRQAADRKFGYGGKVGRFKQNDRQSMNDMSGFNPRGNFADGMKRTAAKTKSGNGAGASRTGKRARDAKRARK